MKWITEKDINDFFEGKDYDIRKTGNARWIDQKCAPDVITIVADCILNYVQVNGESEFSSVDIWHHDYTVQNVESIFKKPNPDEKRARNEYDKFFQQPMEMLSYAGILEKTKKSNKNFYNVNNYEILSYIALRERNSLNFLQLYIEKVLRDSEIWNGFDDFFKNRTNETYNEMKRGFATFIINNTPINGETECFRIFIKVLNPLAYKNNIEGTERGRLSKHRITYDMLMYNRDNFRDVSANKPKELTRKQYEEKEGLSVNKNYTKYLSQKAKRFLRLFNDMYREGKSEVYDEQHMNDIATNIHHIFPENEYQEISAYLENLIALTPTQHFNYAHPLGNTQVVSRDYQHIALLAKTDNIRENIESSDEPIYDFDKFLFVLSIGFQDEQFINIENLDFDAVINQINLKY